MPERHFLKELNPLGGSSFTLVEGWPWMVCRQCLRPATDLGCPALC